MTYAIHPVWSTTQQPQLMRYGLYKISADGEQEIAQAGCLESIEALRQQLLQLALLENA
ncbi:hypothetical protein [Deefgea piscis]|uniref:hypothetical protein n=1 Tax=Deefgea piscis TaxID=2739061 RepID=UPI001C7F2C7E|nr:hypothetical protein [Deefgea piscis]QZA81398.1 hypothetical protein K4H25_01595 [Deefgea piscis]